MKDNNCNQASSSSEKCRQCSVRDLVLFADLQADDLNLISVPIEDFELQAGETLYHEKEAPKFVYTIRSGMLKLVHYSANGSYRIIRLLQQGDLAGIEALHGGSNYLHHAIVLQKTAVCRISIKDIERINSKSTQLYKQLTARWQNVQSDADIWLADLTMGSSRNRMINLLNYLATHSTSETFYLPSREDIGALLAITTETASRIIAEFKRSGFLHTQRNTATINKLKQKQIQ